ncbi:transposase [Romboutsia sedimentorum]|uniref:transposase n=1 Tax=Romboutsia sedimentorum TaxID=1368474 RepID=UPI0024DE0C47|nr:transposase [Romboutsia sedimentorum]MDK2587411.1 transposase [Romboutsia sedimentorum]
MSKKHKKYSKELKLKAVNLYIKEGYSSYQIAEMLEIRSKTQVQNWVNNYKAKGETVFDEETRGRFKNINLENDNRIFKSVEDELKYLRMENEFLKKLSALSDKSK